MDSVKLVNSKLSVEEISDLVASPSCGAISLFVGTTRDNFEKQMVKLAAYLCLMQWRWFGVEDGRFFEIYNTCPGEDNTYTQWNVDYTWNLGGAKAGGNVDTWLNKLESQHRPAKGSKFSTFHQQSHMAVSSYFYLHICFPALKDASKINRKSISDPDCKKITSKTITVHYLRIRTVILIWSFLWPNPNLWPTPWTWAWRYISNRWCA